MKKKIIICLMLIAVLTISIVCFTACNKGTFLTNYDFDGEWEVLNNCEFIKNGETTIFTFNKMAINMKDKKIDFTFNQNINETYFINEINSTDIDNYNDSNRHIFARLSESKKSESNLGIEITILSDNIIRVVSNKAEKSELDYALLRRTNATKEQLFNAKVYSKYIYTLDNKFLQTKTITTITKNGWNVEKFIGTNFEAYTCGSQNIAYDNSTNCYTAEILDSRSFYHQYDKCIFYEASAQTLVYKNLRNDTFHISNLN